MSREQMIALYNYYTSAHCYIIGFVYKKMLYMVTTNSFLNHSYIKAERMSSKRGGWAKLRFRPTNADKEEFIRNGAVCIGSEDLLKVCKNKGHSFEKYVTENVAHTTWTADSIPFYVQGDVEINGVQIQVKFEGAEITNERTLKHTMEIFAK